MITLHSLDNSENFHQERTLKIILGHETDLSKLASFTRLEQLSLELKNTQAFSFPVLKNLESLSFKCDSLMRDEDIKVFFTLKNLKVLKINHTPLKRLILPIGSFTPSLEILSIKNCALTELPIEINQLENLKELSLPNNELKSLPESLKELKQLTHLNLDKNAFSSFPYFLSKLPSLKKLSFDGNHFSHQEIQRIEKLFHIGIK